MAEGFIAGLRGGEAEREAAYSALFKIEAEHANGDASTSRDAAAAEVAMACASPLCEVLCKPATEVGVAEYQRACQVLTALSGIDPARVGGECNRPDQCNIFKVWLTPDSVLGVVLAKEPAALTPEDALIVGCVNAPADIHISTSTGWDAPMEAAGITTGEWMPNLASFFVMNVAVPDDARNMVLLPLLLELLKAPEKLPDFVLRETLPPLQLCAPPCRPDPPPCSECATNLFVCPAQPA